MNNPSPTQNWVLITGCSGFIGIHLIQALIHKGFHIIGLDVAAPPIEIDENFFIFRKIDLLHLQISDIVDNYNVKWLIHLAGISSSKLAAEQPDLTFNVNVLGSINILTAFKNSPFKPHVILPSSSEVYGNRKELTPLTEEDLLLGYSPYAFSKIHAEQSWQFFAELYNFKWTILRFSNTYGRKDASEGYIVEYLIDKCLHNEAPAIHTPYSVNHFLFVSDHINAYLQVLATGSTGIFNIAGPDFLTISELYQKIKSFFIKDSLTLSPHMHSTGGIVLNTDKAHKVLNWSPKFNVDEGIRDLLKK